MEMLPDSAAAACHETCNGTYVSTDVDIGNLVLHPSATLSVKLMQFRTYSGLCILLLSPEVSQLRLEGCIGISEALLLPVCHCQRCFKLSCHVLHLKPGQTLGDQLWLAGC